MARRAKDRGTPTPATATAAARWWPPGSADGSSPAGDVLLGLVDFGNGCGQAGYPGVYLRIADPAIARFLGAGPPLASAGGVHRGVCPTLRAGRTTSGHTAAARTRAGRPIARGAASAERALANAAGASARLADMIGRDQALQALADSEFDVVVIGGGITGAGVALDASTRGY